MADDKTSRYNVAMSDAGRQLLAAALALPDDERAEMATRLMESLGATDDDLDDGDIAAIEQSEQQIARGEDLDWGEVSARLRKEYLGE